MLLTAKPRIAKVAAGETYLYYVFLFISKKSADRTLYKGVLSALFLFRKVAGLKIIKFMKKKIIIGLFAVGTVLAVLPMLAAFEAHVINVTARIENALLVPVREIAFGTVFPQEKLDKQFDVVLSDSFKAEGRVDDVDYFIRQKPKCWNGSDLEPVFGQVTEDGSGGFKCVDPNFSILPLLCPYLSKSEISTDGLKSENDGLALSAFHGPILSNQWTLAVAKSFDVKGHLAKSDQDMDDRWNIDLKVPCFGGHCAQDWESFVKNVNPDAKPEEYIQPIEKEHQLFGCDLWLEVAGISLPGLGCKGKIDLMLVLDRSGSISSTELATLKTAAKAFVDGLAPSVDGVHIGQTSFATTGSLNTHLSSDASAIKANIDALVAGGFTNLMEGITLASCELANLGDGHDRADGDSPDIMVIITDGAPNEPGSDANAQAVAKAAADAAKASGTEIFVVGVGTVASTATYLKDNIVSTPVAGHYFDAVDFDDLQAILEDLVVCD